MKNKLVTSLICLTMLIFSLASPACKSSSQQEAQRVLDQVRQETQKAMNALDLDLAAAAQTLSGQDMVGEKARSLMSELITGRPYIVDICTISRNGKILAVEPEHFRAIEGQDISQQEQVIRLFQTLKPVMSHNFRSVEGFDAADMEYPVFGPEKEITGSISVLFKPEIIIGDIVSRSVGENPFGVMFMQPDGRIIYETDADQIGRNTFVDPLYQSFPQLLSLARKVSEKDSGTGNYQFLDSATKQTVNKEAIWVTFALHGAEWRIVLIHTLTN
jgi:branched-chain amino acid transport system substrate-binding protein